MATSEHHATAAHSSEHVDVGCPQADAAEALRNGPLGALIIASVAVGLLFLGWLLFYFVLFLGRGYIG
jgi:hypothetical protein